MEKFQVFDILRRSLREVFSNFGMLIKAVVVPALLFTGAQLFAVTGGLNFIGVRLVPVILSVLETMLVAPMLVAWYRHVLTGSRATGLAWWPAGGDGRFYRYAFGFALALATAPFAFSYLAGANDVATVFSAARVGSGGGAAAEGVRDGAVFAAILAGVVAVYVFAASLAFVFPAAALRQRLDLLGSWTLAENHRSKAFFVFGFIIIFFTLLEVLLAVPIGLVAGVKTGTSLTAAPISTWVLAALVLTLFEILRLLAWAGIAAAAALMYIELGGPRPARSAAPGGGPAGKNGAKIGEE